MITIKYTGEWAYKAQTCIDPKHWIAQTAMAMRIDLLDPGSQLVNTRFALRTYRFTGLSQIFHRTLRGTSQL